MTDFRERIRDTFRGIDVRQFEKETMGGAKYVSWSKVWDLVLTHFPDSPWPEFSEDWVGIEGDQTCMVQCRLTIKDGEDETSNLMHLPVMESYGQFKAIHNPDARDLSDTRMRCFVKCAGVFGLGLSMWSGEDYEKSNKDLERILAFCKKKSPDGESPSEYRARLTEIGNLVREAYASHEQSDGDGYLDIALEAYRELTESEKADFFIAETKGGFMKNTIKQWFRDAGYRRTQEENAA